MAMLLTQDCELDKQRPTLLFARVRPIPSGMHADQVDLIRRRRQYRSFFLPRSEEYGLPDCIVDFGRITTAMPGAVNSDERIMSLEDTVRDCLRRDFAAYLMSERERA